MKTKLKLDPLWIAEEAAILNRLESYLSETVNSLQSTTNEIETLVCQIRDQLARRRVAYSVGDWDAYADFINESHDLFDGLDWLIEDL